MTTRTWRRARKGERCGYCLDHTFRGGEPVLLIGGLKRCAPVAKARYGEDVPVPFPEPQIVTVATMSPRRPDFVAATGLGHDFKARQMAREPGEDG